MDATQYTVGPNGDVIIRAGIEGDVFVVRLTSSGGDSLGVYRVTDLSLLDAVMDAIEALSSEFRAGGEAEPVVSPPIVGGVPVSQAEGVLGSGALNPAKVPDELAFDLKPPRVFVFIDGRAMLVRSSRSDVITSCLLEHLYKRSHPKDSAKKGARSLQRDNFKSREEPRGWSSFWGDTLIADVAVVRSEVASCGSYGTHQFSWVFETVTAESVTIEAARATVQNGYGSGLWLVLAGTAHHVYVQDEEKGSFTTGATSFVSIGGNVIAVAEWRKGAKEEFDALLDESKVVYDPAKGDIVLAGLKSHGDDGFRSLTTQEVEALEPGDVLVKPDGTLLVKKDGAGGRTFILGHPDHGQNTSDVRGVDSPVKALLNVPTPDYVLLLASIADVTEEPAGYAAWLRAPAAVQSGIGLYFAAHEGSEWESKVKAELRRRVKLFSGKELDIIGESAGPGWFKVEFYDPSKKPAATFSAAHARRYNVQTERVPSFHAAARFIYEASQSSWDNRWAWKIEAESDGNALAMVARPAETGGEPINDSFIHGAPPAAVHPSLLGLATAAIEKSGRGIRVDLRIPGYSPVHDPGAAFDGFYSPKTILRACVRALGITGNVTSESEVEARLNVALEDTGDSIDTMTDRIGADLTKRGCTVFVESLLTPTTVAQDATTGVVRETVIAREDLPGKAWRVTVGRASYDAAAIRTAHELVLSALGKYKPAVESESTSALRKFRAVFSGTDGRTLRGLLGAIDKTKTLFPAGVLKVFRTVEDNSKALLPSDVYRVEGNADVLFAMGAFQTYKSLVDVAGENDFGGADVASELVMEPVRAPEPVVFPTVEVAFAPRESFAGATGRAVIRVQFPDAVTLDVSFDTNDSTKGNEVVRFVHGEVRDIVEVLRKSTADGSRDIPYLDADESVHVTASDCQFSLFGAACETRVGVRFRRVMGGEPEDTSEVLSEADLSNGDEEALYHLRLMSVVVDAMVACLWATPEVKGLSIQGFPGFMEEKWLGKTCAAVPVIPGAIESFGYRPVYSSPVIAVHAQDVVTPPFTACVMPFVFRRGSRIEKRNMVSETSFVVGSLAILFHEELKEDSFSHYATRFVFARCLAAFGREKPKRTFKGDNDPWLIGYLFEVVDPETVKFFGTVPAGDAGDLSRALDLGVSVDFYKREGNRFLVRYNDVLVVPIGLSDAGVYNPDKPEELPSISVTAPDGVREDGCFYINVGITNFKVDHLRAVAGEVLDWRMAGDKQVPFVDRGKEGAIPFFSDGIAEGSSYSVAEVPKNGVNAVISSMSVVAGCAYEALKTLPFAAKIPDDWTWAFIDGELRLRWTYRDLDPDVGAIERALSQHKILARLFRFPSRKEEEGEKGARLLAKFKSGLDKIKGA